MAARLTLLLPLATLVLPFLGCSPGPEDPPDLLRLTWSSDPASLDPAHAVDWVGGAVCALLYEGLVTFDRQGRVEPALASSWQLSDDGRTYSFRLDEAARASDGSVLQAEHVIASFHRLLAPETASPRAWVLDRIEGAGAYARGEAPSISGLSSPETGEVSMTLAEPSASFLGLLAMPNASVVPHGTDGSGGVSTGPWVLAEHVRDSHLMFRRNPFWHGPAAAFEGIRVRVLPEEFTRVVEFEVGNLDVLEVPSSEAVRFREDPSFSRRLHRQVALVTEYVGLNNEDPVLADPRVRRALNLAVDVDLILERVLGGRGVRACGSIPPTLPGGGGRVAFAHDPAQARRLFAEAAVPDDWALELWQRPSPLASQVLEAVQADLRRAGVASKIRLRDWSALKASIDRGDASGFFINWYADYPDPENFLTPLFHSRNIGGGGNRARFRDTGIDRRLEALDLETDATRRAEEAASIDAAIHESAPWIYLWHPILEICVSERVEGYAPHPIPSAERWLDVRPAGAAPPP